MVKKKTTSTPKTRVVYRNAPKKKRHVKSGVTYIPAAGATVGLLIANYSTIKGRLDNIANGNTTTKTIVRDVAYDLRGAVTADRLVKDGMYLVGGYVAGEAIRRFAPNFVKAPLGKIAKKVPKVI